MGTVLEELRAGLAPRYELLTQLGSGGMGLVFEARDTLLRRPVAIKVLRPERASATNVERFLREGRTLARLTHPNVVGVHDAGEVRGLNYLVMDLLQGPTLAEALAAGPWDVPRVRWLGRQLLAGLHAAHAAGVVHRDVKPSNVFLVGERVVVSDFGISLTEDPEAEVLTRDGQRPGTLAYMAPEQLAGRVVDARADQYAAALVLLEAATGRRCAPGEAVRPSTWADVPRALAPGLRRALAVAPEARWPDVHAFALALERPSARRWRAATLIAAALLLLAVLVRMRTTTPGATAFEAPGRDADLAVEPFDDLASPPTGRRIARLVGDALEQFPPLRLVPVPVALEAGPARARHRATGDVEHVGASVRVRVKVRDSAATLLHDFAATGDSGDIERLARDVADSLVRRLLPGELQGFRALAFHRVGDVEAITAYLAGDSAFQHDDWEAAERHYRAALARDPRFLRAAWGLMVARRFQRKDFGAEVSVLRAQLESLPPMQRALLAAQDEPDLQARIARYAEVVRASQGDGEAWLHYTNELFHRGPLVGRALAPTLDSMAILAAVHPDLHHASTYDLLVWGNTRLGRHAEAAAAYARRASVADPAEGFGELHALALALRFRRLRGAIVRHVVLPRAAPSRLDSLAEVARLGLFLELAADQDRIGDLLVRRGDTDSSRATGFVARALAALGQGRPDAGLAYLDSAAQARPSDELALQRAEWPMLLHLLGLPVGERTLARARAALAASAATPTPALRARATFALALDALADGRLDAVTALGRDLRGEAGSVAERLGVLLAAHVAGHDGDAVSALERSAVVRRLDSAGYRSGTIARALTYVRRGEWAAAGGAWQEADGSWLWHEHADLLGWPIGPPQLAEVDAVLAAPAEVWRAELALRLGERRRACERLRMPRDRWRGSEPAWAGWRARVDSLWKEAGCAR